MKATGSCLHGVTFQKIVIVKTANWAAVLLPES
jgi:hypothetical protein